MLAFIGNAVHLSDTSQCPQGQSVEANTGAPETFCQTQRTLSQLRDAWQNDTP